MRLALVFGGTYEMYLKHARIFDSFNKWFEQKGENWYTYLNHELRISFALGPKLCNPLKYSYRHIIKAKEHYPPPANVVAREVKKYDPDKVLFTA
ncbi:hypothetical protein J7L02_03300 [Candidatus Woesearchaeota archaeon]|nr:hypothetical protein [Candidatus Woesearchaeota archaeon]